MHPSNSMRLVAAPPRRLAKLIYRTVVGPPVPDPVRAWRGTARDELQVLRVLHVGDCGVVLDGSRHADGCTQQPPSPRS
jgi:hypothetical protein